MELSEDVKELIKAIKQHRIPDKSKLESPVLTLNEFSAYIKIPKKTIYNWISEGKIPRNLYLKVGRHLRFRTEAVNRWLENDSIGEAL